MDYPLPVGSFGVNCDLINSYLVYWDYDEVSGGF